MGSWFAPPESGEDGREVDASTSGENYGFKVGWQIIVESAEIYENRLRVSGGFSGRTIWIADAQRDGKRFIAGVRMKS